MGYQHHLVGEGGRGGEGRRKEGGMNGEKREEKVKKERERGKDVVIEIRHVTSGNDETTHTPWNRGRVLKMGKGQEGHSEMFLKFF